MAFLGILFTNQFLRGLKKYGRLDASIAPGDVWIFGRMFAADGALDFLILYYDTLFYTNWIYSPYRDHSYDAF